MDRATLIRRAAYASGAVAALGWVVLLSPLHLLGAVAIAAGVAVLAFCRPVWALWLVLTLFLVHPLAMRIATQNFGVTGTALLIASAWKELALGCALLAMLWSAARREGFDSWRRIQPNVLDVAAGLLVVLLVVGLALRHDGLAINSLRLLSFPVAAYVLLRLHPVDPERYFFAIALLGGAIALFGFIQTSFFGWQWVTTYWGTPTYPQPYTFWALHLVGPRASGTLASPNEFGFALATISLMAFGVLLIGRRRRRWLIPLLVLILVGVSVSFSRSAIVGAGIGILAIAGIGGWRYLRDRKRVARLFAAVVVPAALLSGVLYLPRGGTALLQSTIMSLPLPSISFADNSDQASQLPPVVQPNPDLDPSTLDHMASLGSGAEILRTNPFGLGLGTVGSRAVPGTDERPGLVFESWYLTIGVMLGIPGLLWCLFFLLALLIVARRALRRGEILVGLVLLGLTLTTAFISFLLPTMTEPQLAMLPWAVGALAVARGSSNDPVVQPAT